MNAIATAIDPARLEANRGSGYPEPFRSQVLPREKRALGDAAGLTKIGINHTTLGPGAASSMRHWHTHEDELIYVLAGELCWLRTMGSRHSRRPVRGISGRPSRRPSARQSRTEPAVYLEISNRDRPTSRTIRTSISSGTRPRPRARIRTRTGGSTDRGGENASVYRMATAIRFRHKRLTAAPPGPAGWQDPGDMANRGYFRPSFFVAFLRINTQISAMMMIATKSQKNGFFV